MWLSENAALTYCAAGSWRVPNRLGSWYYWRGSSLKCGAVGGGCAQRGFWIAAMYRSIESRKRDEARRRAEVPAALEARLGEFARRRGGRYLLYGSLARGQARRDSDVDLLVDFPPEFEAEAWRLAEDACAALKIESDIKPLAWCAKAFRDKVVPGARIIP